MKRAEREGRRAHVGPLVALVILLVLAVWPAHARDQRTVFHGLPMEPESGFRPAPSKKPIAFSKTWMFDEFGSPLAGPPTGDARIVVASDRSGVVVALDAAEGRRVWEARLGEELATGPVLHGDTILQGTAAGAMVAIDAGTGHVAWRVDLGSAPLAIAGEAAGRLFVTTCAPALIALDPVTGAIAARLPLPGLPVLPTLVPSVIVVGTEHGMLMAIDPATFEVRWRRYLRHPITAPPFVHGKRVYVAVGDRSLRCLRLKSGDPIWRQRMGSIATTQMFASGDFVYVPSWDNDIYVVRSGNGHMAARVRLDHRLSLDAALGPEYVFMAPFTEGSVVALSLPMLGMAGRFNLDMPGEWFTTAPVLIGERLAVGSGRETGRVVGLSVNPAPPPSADAGAHPPPAAGAHSPGDLPPAAPP
jgi:outer membrane protein assembly factor BamB